MSVNAHELKLRFLNKLTEGIVTAGLDRSGVGVENVFSLNSIVSQWNASSLRLWLINRLYPAKTGVTKIKRASERSVLRNHETRWGRIFCVDKLWGRRVLRFPKICIISGRNDIFFVTWRSFWLTTKRFLGETARTIFFKNHSMLFRWRSFVRFLVARAINCARWRVIMWNLQGHK